MESDYHNFPLAHQGSFERLVFQILSGDTAVRYHRDRPEPKLPLLATFKTA